MLSAVDNWDPEVDFHTLRDATRAGLVGRAISGVSIAWGITVVVLLMWLVDQSRNGLLAIWIVLAISSAIWTTLRVVSRTRLHRQEKRRPESGAEKSAPEHPIHGGGDSAL
jgi:hypothetical protein